MGFGHLERLQYKDALEQREAQRHDPLGGLFSAVIKTVQESEESGHHVDGQQEEPTQEHTPPWQPATRCTLFLLLHYDGGTWVRGGGGHMEKFEL